MSLGCDTELVVELGYRERLEPAQHLEFLMQGGQRRDLLGALGSKEQSDGRRRGVQITRPGIESARAGSGWAWRCRASGGRHEDLVGARATNFTN